MQPPSDPAFTIEKLVREHGPAVERFLRARLDAASARDIYQEVWRAAQSGLPGLKQRSRPLVWLLGIARNKILDARCSPKMEQLWSQLSRPGPHGSLLGLRKPATPASVVMERERTEAVRAALLSLSPEDRELLDLRYVAGLKPAEIAELIGDASPNTISQRTVRAAKRLRDALSGNELFPSRGR
jgi:RNA polymerase sigma-70 factor (ECF subfamily)